MRRAAQRLINYIKSERGMSPATVHSYREDLRKFIEFLENHWGRCLLPGDVTPEMIQAFLDFLANTGYQKKNGPASRARRLAHRLQVLGPVLNCLAHSPPCGRAAGRTRIVEICVTLYSRG